MILEYAVIQHKGDFEKSEKWMKRFKKDIFDILKNLQYGDFIVFDGSELRLDVNPNYKYDCC